MAIIINKNDSPKFYLYVQDIYNEPLGIEPSDFEELSYTISKVSGVNRIPIEKFTNVTIPSDHFYKEPQPYPDNIKNVTDLNKSTGYNLKFFPYVAVSQDGDPVWKSPFSDSNSLYEIAIKLTYYMKDDALEGTALLTRTLTIDVQTRS